MKKQVALGIILTSQLLCAARADEMPNLNEVHGLYQICTDTRLATNALARDLPLPE